MGLLDQNIAHFCKKDGDKFSYRITISPEVLEKIDINKLRSKMNDFIYSCMRDDIEMDDEDGEEVEWRYSEYDDTRYPFCPKCETMLSDCVNLCSQKYCMNCGQKLEWD